MKIRTILAAIFMFAMSFSAMAQCVPMNGPFVGPSGHLVDPPRMWDGSRGCYTWQGAQASQSQQQIVNVNGQQMVWVRLPNGQMALVPYQQQQPVSFPAQQVFQQQHYPQQQVMQQVAGAGGGFSKCEVVGGVTGATIGSMAHNHRPQAVVLGGIVGGMLGNVACRPTQALPVQQPIQTVAQQQFPQEQGSPVCGNGKRPGILNIPGHQKHGQHVCAFPGDPNISQWL
jgi:hypothetical protein